MAERCWDPVCRAIEAYAWHIAGPWMITGAMNRTLFETFVETQLAPTPRSGAWFLFLPPYSMDLNPIEMAFAKLKAHPRHIGVHTIKEFWKSVGSICNRGDRVSSGIVSARSRQFSLDLPNGLRSGGP